MRKDTCWRQRIHDIKLDTFKNTFNNSSFSSNQILSNKININVQKPSDCSITTINTNLYNTTTSFNMYAVDDYLYIGVYVKDPNILALNTINGSGIELYFNNDSTKRSFYSYTDSGQNAYKIETDLRILIPFTGEQLKTFSGANLTTFGMNISNSDALFYVKKCIDGYSIEGMINRTTIGLLNEFNNSPNQLCQDYIYGFDIANNISNGIEKVAQTMWNACCTNRNPLESANWGYIQMKKNPNFQVTCNPYERFIYPVGSVLTSNTNLGIILYPFRNDNYLLFPITWKLEQETNQGSVMINSITGAISVHKNGVITISGSYNILLSGEIKTYKIFTISGFRLENLLEKQISNITIYPNPTTSKVHLTTGFDSESEILLTDIAGKTLQSFTSTSNETDIDLSTYSNGMYFFKITNNLGKYIAKVIKMK